jgi:hypothetical protein
MFTKFIVVFSILALAAAMAGNVPVKGPTCHVKLTESATANGTVLKAGDYKVTVNPGKVTFAMDKESHEVPAKVETGVRKFEGNEVQYEHAASQTTIKEIVLGGTKTRLLFN